MKKILLVITSMILMIFMLVGCSSLPTAQVNGSISTTSANVVEGIEAYDLLEEFVTQYPNRTSGYTTTTSGITNDDSRNAAMWISEQFSSFGYETPYDEQGGLQKFGYKNPITDRAEESYNVVYTKKSATPDAKTVVIGAHYDNVSNVISNNQMIGGDGTYNNATGVIALIELAKVLSTVDLAYNVEFVAFGAEESGSFGSKYYINTLASDVRDNIIVMVNFDRVAGGDYIYMYSSEAITDHNKFFYNSAEENSLAITNLPTYLRPYALSYADEDLSYTNEAMMGDSNVFLLNDINIVNMISMNFSDTSDSTIKEREGLGNVSYTKNDTLSNMKVRLGTDAESIIDNQIANAVSVVFYAMTDADFVQVMETSTPNNGLDLMMNQKIMTAISIGAMALVALILIILYFVLSEDATTHAVIIETPMGRVDVATGQVVGGPIINSNRNNNNVGNTNNNANSKIDVFGEDGGDFGDDNADNSIDNADDESSQINKDNDIFGEF